MMSQPRQLHRTPSADDALTDALLPIARLIARCVADELEARHTSVEPLPPAGLLLTYKEVEQQYGIGYEKVRWLVARGALETRQVPRRRTPLVTEASVRAWQRRQRAEGKAG
jgi:hypothetical protein